MEDRAVIGDAGTMQPPPPPMVDQPCHACRLVTKHWQYPDGRMVCTLCTARAQQAQMPPPRPQSQVGLVRNLVGVAVLGLLVWYSGSVHCVKTPNGYEIVDKEEWGFYDQFTNTEDFVGTSRLELLSRARTVRALIRAGLLRFPDDE